MLWKPAGNAKFRFRRLDNLGSGLTMIPQGATEFATVRKAPQPILRSLSHFQARSHLLQHPLPRSGLSFKFLFAAFQNFVAETTRNLAVCEEFHCERPLTLRH